MHLAPPASSMHTSVHQLPALRPHGQSPIAQASWGALVGVQVTQVATVGTLRRPCLPRPAPPGRDHRALKPTAALAGPDLPRPTAGHKGFLVETLLALSVREGPGQLAPLRPAPGLVME